MAQRKEITWCVGLWAWAPQEAMVTAQSVIEQEVSKLMNRAAKTRPTQQLDDWLAIPGYPSAAGRILRVVRRGRGAQGFAFFETTDIARRLHERILSTPMSFLVAGWATPPGASAGVHGRDIKAFVVDAQRKIEATDTVPGLLDVMDMASDASDPRGLEERVEIQAKACLGRAVAEGLDLSSAGARLRSWCMEQAWPVDPRPAQPGRPRI